MVTSAAITSFPDALKLLTVCYNFWCSKQSTVAVDSNVRRIQFNAFGVTAQCMKLIFFSRWASNKEGVCINWNQTKCEAEQEDLLFEK